MEHSYKTELIEKIKDIVREELAKGVTGAQLRIIVKLNRLVDDWKMVA